MTKLTILMPVYNGEKFLKEAIESVLRQPFNDYEFLIIDDRSDDHSKDIILSYADGRIRFVQNRENLGQAQTLNFGIGLSRGQYIARMDQDDTSLPERFVKETDVLDRFPDLSLVYSDTFIIDEEGRRKEKTMFEYTRPSRVSVFTNLLKRNFVAGNTVMVRKDVFREIGLFNPVYQIASEYDLSLRLAHRQQIDFINEPLAEYRVHSKNRSADAEKAANEVIEILSSFNSSDLTKKEKDTLTRMVSLYTANLSMLHLFKYNRQFCKAKAIKALRINSFNVKAIAAMFMAAFLPKYFIDCVGSLRTKRLG